MSDWIAERNLVAVNRKTGERKEFTIRIGVPYWSRDRDFATCPVSWDGLIEGIAHPQGLDLVQALFLASDLDTSLTVLRKKYDFFWPTGEPYFEK